MHGDGTDTGVLYANVLTLVVVLVVASAVSGRAGPST